MAESTRLHSRLWEQAQIHFVDMIERSIKGHVEQVEQRRKTAAEFRDTALQFIRINMLKTGEEGVARRRILQMYDDALASRDRGDDLLLENRIAEMLAIMYSSGGDDETRRKNFTELGLSGTADRQLNFQETRRFFILYLFAKKYGKKLWGFAADMCTSVVDHLERRPTGAKSFLDGVLERVLAEIREDRGRYDESAELYEDGGSYRADIREWMQKQTAAMQEAHKARLARGDEETYITRRGDAEIQHHRVARKNWTTLYAILIILFVFGIAWLFN